MFGTAGHTDFDVRFELFHIPIRIHPFFWLSALWIFWNPNNPKMIPIGVLCLFLSVLVHELGHAVMLRRYGYPSEIVLYFLGGYATATALSPGRNIRMSLAGPGAGLAFLFLIYLIFKAIISFQPTLFDSYPVLVQAFRMMVFASGIINIMNLIPCLPLDGGRVMEAVARSRFRTAPDTVLKISAGVAAATAVWSWRCLQTGRSVFPISYDWMPDLEYAVLQPDYLQPDPKFMMIFFGILCAQSVISLQQHRRF